MSNQVKITMDSQTGYLRAYNMRNLWNFSRDTTNASTSSATGNSSFSLEDTSLEKNSSSSTNTNYSQVQNLKEIFFQRTSESSVEDSLKENGYDELVDNNSGSDNSDSSSEEDSDSNSSSSSDSSSSSSGSSSSSDSDSNSDEENVHTSHYSKSDQLVLPTVRDECDRPSVDTNDRSIPSTDAVHDVDLPNCISGGENVGNHEPSDVIVEERDGTCSENIDEKDINMSSQNSDKHCDASDKIDCVDGANVKPNDGENSLGEQKLKIEEDTKNDQAIDGGAITLQSDIAPVENRFIESNDVIDYSMNTSNEANNSIECVNITKDMVNQNLLGDEAEPMSGLIENDIRIEENSINIDQNDNENSEAVDSNDARRTTQMNEENQEKCSEIISKRDQSISFNTFFINLVHSKSKSYPDISIIKQHDLPIVPYNRIRSYSLCDTLIYKNNNNQVMRRRRSSSTSDLQELQLLNRPFDIWSSREALEVDFRSLTPSVEIITVNPNEDSMDSEYELKHESDVSCSERVFDPGQSFRNCTVESISLINPNIQSPFNTENENAINIHRENSSDETGVVVDNIDNSFKLADPDKLIENVAIDGLTDLHLEDIDHVVNSCDFVDLKTDEVVVELNTSGEVAAFVDHLTGDMEIEEIVEKESEEENVTQIENADIGLIESDGLSINNAYEEIVIDNTVCESVQHIVANNHNTSETQSKANLTANHESCNFNNSGITDVDSTTKTTFDGVFATPHDVKEQKLPERLASILKTIADFSPPVKNVLFDVYVRTPGRSLLEPQTTVDYYTSPVSCSGGSRSKASAKNKTKEHTSAHNKNKTISPIGTKAPYSKEANKKSNLLLEDLSDDACEFDLASYITEEDCAGLLVPNVQMPPSSSGVALPKTPGEIGKTNLETAVNHSPEISLRWDRQTQPEWRRKKTREPLFANDNHTKPSECNSSMLENFQKDSSFSTEDESVVDVVTVDDKCQAQNNLRSSPFYPKTIKGLGVGKGKNIKTICIPESDGTDDEDEFKIDDFEESSNDSDDSKKDDPDYCVDADAVSPKKISRNSDKKRNNIKNTATQKQNRNSKLNRNEDKRSQKNQKTKLMKNAERECSKLVDIRKIQLKNDSQITKISKNSALKTEQTALGPKLQKYNLKPFKTNIIDQNKPAAIGNFSDINLSSKNNLNSSAVNSELVNSVVHRKQEVSSLALETKSPNNVEDNFDSKINKQTKRKLNLQEYMMRKKSGAGNSENNSSNKDTALTTSSGNISVNNSAYKIRTPPMAKEISAVSRSTPQNNYTGPIDKSKLINTMESKIEKVVNKIEPKIDNPAPKPKVFDPIGDASRKALMLRKNNRKERDIEHMIPVIPPSAIVPLEAMIKEKVEVKPVEPELPRKCNPDYEEIVLVSIGVNTTISKGPNASPPPKSNKLSFSLNQKKILPNNIFEQDKNKLKVLVDINDRIRSKKDAKITSNSLISSIQDAVLRTASPQSDASCEDKIADTTVEERGDIVSTVEYGEDKVIMHLRKDRQRSKVASVACQADLDSCFKPLEKIKSADNSADENKKFNDSSKRSRTHNRSRSRSKKRKSEKRCSSRSPEYRQRGRKNRQRVQNSKSRHVSRSRNRSRSPCDSRYRRSRCSISSISSRSSSGDQSRRSKSIGRSLSRSCSRSRSRSSSRSRNKNFRKRRKSESRRSSSKERRVVFVGHLKPSMNKIDLKNLFKKYGTISNVSLHSKDNGTRYGFVTFTSGRSALDAVDRSFRDPWLKDYKVAFGGRRHFCDTVYSDLDGGAVTPYQNMATKKIGAVGNLIPVAASCGNAGGDDSFEALLAEMKEKLAKNKKDVPVLTNN